MAQRVQVRAYMVDGSTFEWSELATAYPCVEEGACSHDEAECYTVSLCCHLLRDQCVKIVGDAGVKGGYLALRGKHVEAIQVELKN